MTLFLDHPTLWLWLGVFSLATFIGTLGIIPWLILQVPYDYFLYDKPRELPWAKSHPVIKGGLAVLKNVLGFFLLLTGVMLLVLPGQGLLTILLGLLLIDFPGKFRLECWLVRRRSILRSVNWMRDRHGRRPLEFGEDCH